MYLIRQSEVNCVTYAAHWLLNNLFPLRVLSNFQEILS